MFLRLAGPCRTRLPWSPPQSTIPISNELFAAARGEGATLNGNKIHVSKIKTLSTSLLCTGFPVHNRKGSPNLRYYGDFTMHSHGVRRDGSAALDLASVAVGRFEGFWEFGLKAWDTAAGVLLVEEAGGKVTDFSGQPYQLGGQLSSPPTASSTKKCAPSPLKSRSRTRYSSSEANNLGPQAATKFKSQRRCRRWLL